MRAYIKISDNLCTNINGVAGLDTIDKLEPLLDIVQHTTITRPACFNKLQLEMDSLMIRQSANTFSTEPTIQIRPTYDCAQPRHVCCDAHICCAEKLAAGKCCDPYMRATVGAILYPNHYQKTK